MQDPSSPFQFVAPPPIPYGPFAGRGELSQPLVDPGSLPPLMGGLGPLPSWAGAIGMPGQFAALAAIQMLQGPMASAGFSPGQLFGLYNYNEFVRNQQLRSQALMAGQWSANASFQQIQQIMQGTAPVGAATPGGDAAMVARVLQGFGLMQYGPGITPTERANVERAAIAGAQNIQAVGGFLAPMLLDPQFRQALGPMDTILSGMFGGRILASQMYMNLQQAGGPTSPETAARMASELQAHYSPGGLMDISRTRGFNLPQIGDLYAELSRRGRLPGMLEMPQLGREGFERNVSAASVALGMSPAEIRGMTMTATGMQDLAVQLETHITEPRIRETKQKLDGVLKAVGAMREILGPNATMSELVSGLEQLAGADVYMNPDRAQRVVYQMQELARYSGVSSQNIQRITAMSAMNAAARGLGRSEGAGWAETSIGATRAYWRNQQLAGNEMLGVEMTGVMGAAQRQMEGEAIGQESNRAAAFQALVGDADLRLTGDPARDAARQRLSELRSDLINAARDPSAARRALMQLGNTYDIANLIRQAGLQAAPAEAIQERLVSRTTAERWRRTHPQEIQDIGRALTTSLVAGTTAIELGPAMGGLLEAAGERLTPRTRNERGAALGQEFMTAMMDVGVDPERLRQWMVTRLGGEAHLRRRLGARAGEFIDVQLPAQVQNAIDQAADMVGGLTNLHALAARQQTPTQTYRDAVQAGAGASAFLAATGWGQTGAVQRLINAVSQPGAENMTITDVVGELFGVRLGGVGDLSPEERLERWRRYARDAGGGRAVLSDEEVQRIDAETNAAKLADATIRQLYTQAAPGVTEAEMTPTQRLRRDKAIEQLRRIGTEEGGFGSAAVAYGLMNRYRELTTSELALTEEQAQAALSGVSAMVGQIEQPDYYGREFVGPPAPEETVVRSPEPESLIISRDKSAGAAEGAVGGGEPETVPGQKQGVVISGFTSEALQVLGNALVEAANATRRDA